MRLTSLIPAALLVTSIIATPVVNGDWILNQKRQIPRLDSVFDLVKGIMQQGGIADASSVASPVKDPANIEGYTRVTDCVSAIQKIDDSLSISAEFMAASSEPPTLRQINAVLSVLERSLSQCSANISGNIDQQNSRMIGKKTGFEVHIRRAVICTECERGLFGVVKQLRVIFSLGDDKKDDTAVVKGIADAITQSGVSFDVTESTPGQKMRFATMIKAQADIVKSASIVS